MIVNINKNSFKTKVLINKNDQKIGMMGKTFDDSFDALLFMMGNEKQCFWMKNCVIPLDIIIIYNNEITKIHHDCPPCKSENCPSYCGEGNIVMEVEGGTCKELGISEGDFIEYVI